MADTMKGLKRTHYCGTVTPEMIGRDLNESRAYAKAMVDRALTPEVKKERQRGVSRER